MLKDKTTLINDLGYLQTLSEEEKEILGAVNGYDPACQGLINAINNVPLESTAFEKLWNKLLEKDSLNS